MMYRASLGQKKYGFDLISNPLTKLQWIEHAKEEALDLANYLTRLQEPIQVVENKCGNCVKEINNIFIYCPFCGAVLKF